MIYLVMKGTYALNGASQCVSCPTGISQYLVFSKSGLLVT